MQGRRRGGPLATFDDLEVGQRATYTKTVSLEDVFRFVRLTGDANPLHVDPEFAGRTFFGGTIAHGMLSASLISTVIGMFLPGTGAIYRSQTVEFLRPVHPGDTLTAWAEVRACDPEANRVELASGVEDGEGRAVIRGRSVVSLLRGFRE